ncbi:MAG TPA: sugar ABC transporter substrate-binding protein [Rectinemataceae bacterium]|nr:sugar ABC transporter substrate-binding protein [Rectinemataceae bacterium]
MKRLALLIVILVSVLMPMFSAPTTLTVLWFNDANESEVFQNTMADYVAKNPNVKLDVQVVAFSAYEQKLKLMIAGGNPPDVARVTNNQISALIDVLLPLDGKIQGLEEMKKNYLPASLAFALDGKGKLVAFPTEATANGMLVNKTAFKNAGIDVDAISKTWTWADWETIIAKVIAANSKMKYGLAVDFTPHRFSTLMFQQGGHFLNATQTGMDFENPGTIASLRFFKNLHDKGLIPKSVWMGSENPAELFQAGLVACHIGGSWNINTYKQNVKDFEWGAVRMPKGTINSSVPGGKFIATFKGGKNEAEALRLITAFADKEHTSAYVRDTFNLSSRTDTVVNYPSNSKDFAIFLEELKVTPSFTANEWKNVELNKVSTFIREQIVQVLMGNLTPEQAAKAVQEKGSTYFK